MNNNSRYSTGSPAGREHFPIYPKGFIAIRIVQLVLAVVILAIDAYTLSVLAWRANGLNAFTSIVTIGITIYYLVVNFSRDAWKHYNYWAVMSLDMFAILFWLISLAIMAADIAPYADETEVCDYYYGTCTWLGAIFFACLAAIAGLGGAECLLFVTSLAIHSVAMHRHRAAGRHSTSYNNSTDNGDMPPPPIPLSVVSPEKQVVQENVYAATAPAGYPDLHQQRQQQPVGYPQC